MSRDEDDLFDREEDSIMLLIPNSLIDAAPSSKKTSRIILGSQHITSQIIST